MRDMRVLTFASVFILGSSLPLIAAPLRSPWDGKKIEVQRTAYACPDVPALPQDITARSYYSDDKHSVTDPKLYAEYNAVQEQYRGTAAAAEKAADAFVKSGSAGASACVLKILDTQAAAGAMLGKMSTNQAYYMQGWTMGGMAIAYLKVRNSGIGTPEQHKKITKWLHDVGVQVQTYFETRHQRQTNDGRNNHFYWGGFAVMGAAIASDDRALYTWAAGTYKDGLSRVADDGTLPLEMDRGQRALHYHLFALQPLVMLAEMQASNGEDSYHMQHDALPRLVDRTASGIKDNSYFEKKAGVKQDTPTDKGLKSEDLIWAVPYLKHVENPELRKLLQSVEIRPSTYLGGLPPA